MGLLDISAELAATQNQKPHRSCGVMKWLADLPEDEYTAVSDAMYNVDNGSQDLWLVLRANGAPFSETSLRRHRKGVCGCGA